MVKIIDNWKKKKKLNDKFCDLEWLIRECDVYVMKWIIKSEINVLQTSKKVRVIGNEWISFSYCFTGGLLQNDDFYASMRSEVSPTIIIVNV